MRLRFEPGACTVVGRRSEQSLYDLSLATYGSGDAFDQSDAEGYVRLYGLPLKVWSAKQGALTERGGGEAPATAASRSGRAGSRRRRRRRRTRSAPVVHFDVRLAPHDVDASIAHVAALEDAGLLDAEDAGRLTEALTEVEAEIADGSIRVRRRGRGRAFGDRARRHRAAG